jgi:hypothetical protein
MKFISSFFIDHKLRHIKETVDYYLLIYYTVESCCSLPQNNINQTLNHPIIQNPINTKVTLELRNKNNILPSL